MTQELVLAGQLEPALSSAFGEGELNRSSYEEAFARVFAASQALPADKLVHLNVDIKQACVTLVGALPKIVPFRSRLALLPEFELACVDQFPLLLRATMSAESTYDTTCSEPRRAAELAEQARKWCRLFGQDVGTMVMRGLLPAEQLDRLKAQTSYVHLAFKLLGLTALYRTNWAKLSGYTTLKPEELEHTQALGEALTEATARLPERHQAIREANDQRRRNFTLLARAYDQVRAGVHYLRWREGDAESIAPSLYQGRGGSRRKQREPASDGFAQQ
ncbi:MAG TPA: hypothetical protein VHV51_07360 [Polyangiaceae bacterium]|jgi:hypothetical protein|nr:hypothetical protein [Polyangiaceae bacterium]